MPGLVPGIHVFLWLLPNKVVDGGGKPGHDEWEYTVLMPTIYYIRHGQTEWNALGRLQGVQDIPLNELGRTQSVNAGQILAALFRRARQTMDLVRGVLKLPLSGYAIDDRLREIGYGEWEGATLAEMQAKDPELFARRQIEKWTVAPPG